MNLTFRDVLFFFALLFPFLVGGCAGEQESAGELQVAAAVSLSEAVSEIGGLFEQETGTALEYNFAGSSTLARQIENGFPADVFLSAHEDWIVYLRDRDLLDISAAEPFAYNSLVVVTASESPLDISNLSDLADPAVRTIALGDPEHVPGGIYARRALENAGVWAQIKEKVVGAVDVRAAMAMVENGAADCAVVYRTDALVSQRVEVRLSVPNELTPEIRYVGAKTARSTRSTAAEFLTFLQSPQAQSVLKKHGFTVRNGTTGDRQASPLHELDAFRSPSRQLNPIESSPYVLDGATESKSEKTKAHSL